jgi:hypothetical protein
MADANGTDRHVYYDRNDSYATVLTPASSAAKAEPAPDDEGLRAQDAVKVTKAQWEAINEAFKDIAFDGFGKYPNAVQVFWDPSSAHLNSYTTNKERSSVNYLPFHEFWRRAEITLEQRKPKVPTIKYRDDHGRGNTYVLTPQKGLVISQRDGFGATVLTIPNATVRALAKNIREGVKKFAGGLNDDVYCKPDASFGKAICSEAIRIGLGVSTGASDYQNDQNLGLCWGSATREVRRLAYHGPRRRSEIPVHEFLRMMYEEAKRPAKIIIGGYDADYEPTAVKFGCVSIPNEDVFELEKQLID